MRSLFIGTKQDKKDEIRAICKIMNTQEERYLFSEGVTECECPIENAISSKVKRAVSVETH